MAAPSGTTWGSAVGGSGKKFKLGIYTSVGDNSATTTTVTVNVQVWVWTQVSVSDTSNTFYYNANATSASTSKGSVTVKTTVNSSWSTSNQKKIASYSHTGIAKSTASYTYNVAAALKGLDYPGASSKATVNRGTTIPALTSYTIAFNANGGSGNTGSQTKYYGRAITLNAAPSRTGYRFNGWKWNNSGTAYSAGSSWNGANASGTMYAQWLANNYYISFDGNGATGGSMATQTFTYDVAQNLTLNKFTKTDGLKQWALTSWNKSQDGTSTSYADGASIKNLTSVHGTTIKLYAQWELLHINPTATVSNVTGDTGDVFYAGITTASINITDITAYDGSYIDRIEFHIGQDEDHKQYTEQAQTYQDETLEINISSEGTYIPYFRIIDDFGSERIYNLDTITVLPYSVSTNIIQCSRINESNGKLEDTGRNAVLELNVDYADVNKNYFIKPLIGIDEVYSENYDVDWYRAWDPSSGFSDGPIQFSSSSQFVPPVKIYGRIKETLETRKTYKISAIGRTYCKSGNESVYDLHQSFYLLSASPGGHGLGIGVKPTTDDFYVDMNSYFYGDIMAYTMAGIVQMFGGVITQTVTNGIAYTTGVPKEWLLCDGGSLLIEEYPELAAALYDDDRDVYIYGSVDNTHFNLPDFRSRMPVGIGGDYSLNSKGGSTNIQAHTHSHTTDIKTTNTQTGVSLDTTSKGAHSHIISANKDTVKNGSSYMRPLTYGSSSATSTNAYATNAPAMAAHTLPNHTHTVGGGGVGAVKNISTGNSGNMPPYIGMNFIIATGRKQDIITHEEI